MGRMVLLQHTLDDGSSHYDWLIERDVIGTQATDVHGRDPDDRCLLAFRVVERIDGEKSALFDADRMPDHRYHYLEYQGPISGGRGTVKRVASGIARHVVEQDGTVQIRGKWAKGEERVWSGRLGQGEDALWRFERSGVLIGRPKPPKPDSDQPPTLGDTLSQDFRLRPRGHFDW